MELPYSGMAMRWFSQESVHNGKNVISRYDYWISLRGRTAHALQGRGSLSVAHSSFWGNVYIRIEGSPKEFYPVKAMKQVQRRMWVFVCVAGVLMALFGLAYIGLAYPVLGAIPAAQLKAGTGIVLMGAALPAFVDLIYRWQAVILTRQAGGGNIVTTLSEEGYSVKTSKSNSTWYWPSFYPVVEREKWWLLYTRKNVAVIVPKNLLTTEQQSEFREFLLSLNYTK